MFREPTLLSQPILLMLEQAINGYENHLLIVMLNQIFGQIRQYAQINDKQ